jgi:hypothetical protein
MRWRGALTLEAARGFTNTGGRYREPVYNSLGETQTAAPRGISARAKYEMVLTPFSVCSCGAKKSLCDSSSRSLSLSTVWSHGCDISRLHRKSSAQCLSQPALNRTDAQDSVHAFEGELALRRWSCVCLMLRACLGLCSYLCGRHRPLRSSMSATVQCCVLWYRLRKRSPFIRSSVAGTQGVCFPKRMKNRPAKWPRSQRRRMWQVWASAWLRRITALSRVFLLFWGIRACF